MRLCLYEGPRVRNFDAGDGVVVLTRSLKLAEGICLLRNRCLILRRGDRLLIQLDPDSDVEKDWNLIDERPKQEFYPNFWFGPACLLRVDPPWYGCLSDEKGSVYRSLL